MTTEGDGRTPFDACAHCGDTFERDVRYPVTTREGPDGDLELYSFCDEVCQSAWLEAR